METEGLSDSGNELMVFRFGLRRLLLLVAICAVCFALLRYAIVEAERQRVIQAELRTAIEISSLERALQAYKVKYGALPPSMNAYEIAEHVARVHPRGAENALERANKRDLTALDDGESLVFWLSGEAAALFDDRSPGYPLYEFDPRRLVDTDKNGWPEYTDRDGNVFRLTNGRVVRSCPETGRIISMKYFNANYGTAEK